MPTFLITFGKWLWALPTWAKLALLVLTICGIVAGYIWFLRSENENLREDLNQSEVNGAMIEVNTLTNKIEEGKRNDVNLQANTRDAERNSANIALRDSNSYSGTTTYEQFCARYCHDSRCERYRRVRECR